MSEDPLSAHLRRLQRLREQGLISATDLVAERQAVLARARGSAQAPSVGHPSPPMDAQAPSIGAYVVLERIGVGGMGIVYRGRHRLDRKAEQQGGDVAIKVLHPHLVAERAFAGRFEREGVLGMKLRHPGIVRVHDLVVDGRQLALVMEYVQGRSLADLIGTEQGPIPWPKARGLFAQVVEAVEYAHKRGVVHRDLKPDNIMVRDDGSIVVLDFGIARFDGAPGKTATGATLGTVEYMAPEQHRSADTADERADVYGLGMTLYEMVAGRLPYPPGLGVVEVMLRKDEGQLPTPTEFYPHIPDDVVLAIARAIESDPADRFPSVRAFLDSLEGQESAESHASPEQLPPTPGRASKSSGRSWLLPLGLAGALGLTLVLMMAGTQAEGQIIVGPMKAYGEGYVDEEALRAQLDESTKMEQFEKCLPETLQEGPEAFATLTLAVEGGVAHLASVEPASAAVHECAATWIEGRQIPVFSDQTDPLSPVPGTGWYQLSIELSWRSS